MNDAEQMIAIIFAWAEDHPEFDISFVEDLDVKLSEYGELTDAQIAALENIIEKWHIN